MKKHIFGRQFKRDINERKALFKGLMNELVLHERIVTTQEKAKSIRGQVEKLITKAKRKKEASRYLLQPYVSSSAVEKIIIDLAPRFADRPGGYVRIIKLGNRFSDNARMAVIELTESAVSVGTVTHHTDSVEHVEVISPTAHDVKEAEIIQSDVVEPKKTKKKAVEKKISSVEEKRVNSEPKKEKKVTVKNSNKKAK